MEIFKQSSEESELYELGQRYDTLRKLHKDVIHVTWQEVIKEMKETMACYDRNWKETIINCIENRETIPRTGKRAMNCVAICCALFSEKFRDLWINDIMYDKTDRDDIDDIIDSFYKNITSMLPCISHSLLAVRMVEVMLYTMFPISRNYKANDKHWSMLGVTCFRHPGASSEIKIASSIIVCHLDKGYFKYIVCQYLKDILLKESFFGFKEKDIIHALFKMHYLFTSSIGYQDLDTEKSTRRKMSSSIDYEERYYKDDIQNFGYKMKDPFQNYCIQEMPKCREDMGIEDDISDDIVEEFFKARFPQYSHMNRFVSGEGRIERGYKDDSLPLVDKMLDEFLKDCRIKDSFKSSASANMSATPQMRANMFQKVCTICEDEIKNCILNCGHIFCRTCADKETYCYVCRNPITDRKFIYY